MNADSDMLRGLLADQQRAFVVALDIVQRERDEALSRLRLTHRVLDSLEEDGEEPGTIRELRGALGPRR